MYAFYTVSMIAAALVAGLLLRRYADPLRVTLIVVTIAWFSWLVSLSVVALVPLDVYTTLVGFGNIHAITILWKLSYWSTQVLTWALIPIVQGYVLSGSFTVTGRMRSALRRLWRFWLVVGCLAIAGVLIAAAWGKLHLSTLPQLIVLLSNTYGLVAVVVLLGYGLVEVPRVLWRRSFPESRLTWHLHRLGRAAARLEEASKELERCMAVVLITTQSVPRADGDLRRKAEGLLTYFDTKSPVPVAALATSKSVDVESLEERDLEYATNAAGLAKLRGRVKLAIAEFVGSKGDYVSFLRKAMELDAVCKSRQLQVYTDPGFRSSSGGSTGTSTSSSSIAAAKEWMRNMEWRYKCVGRPYVQRLLAFLLGLTSATIVWCEATIGSGRHPDLSPFSLLIHDPQVLDSSWGVQALVALPLAYSCAAAYFSLFKLGSLGAYHMVPKATWSWSLLLNGSLLARFAAPLAYNYLHVIRMAGTQKGGRTMVFVNLMAMEDVPLLGTGFNTWFPLVMVVYVLILVTDVCGACAARLCSSSLVKMLLPAKMRIHGERPDQESVARGRGLMAAECDVAARGGEMGEGTALFGMVLHHSDHRTDGTANTSRSSLMDKMRIEMSSGIGGTAAVASTSTSGTTTRPPLFGYSHSNNDGNSDGNGNVVPASSSSPRSPDAADRLFAAVGGGNSRPTMSSAHASGRRNGRSAWDV